MTAPGLDPRLGALGREQERLARRVAQVETLARELDGMLRALAERIEALAPAEDGGDEPEGLASWLAADDPEQARLWLADLTGWVGAVYLRYPDAALPSCFLWHPAVVEELLWLRHAHADAYDGRSGSWQRVADWHDRQRPGVVKRVSDAVASCELPLHEQPTTPPAAPLADAAEHIADIWTEHRTTPAPTEQQLHDAEHHDRTNHRSSQP